MTFKRTLCQAVTMIFLTTTLAPAGFAAESEWAPLWLGTEKPTKGDTYLPDGLTASMFDLSEDEVAVVEVDDSVSEIARDVLMDDEDATPVASASTAEERTPASVKRTKTTKKPKAKAGLKKVTLLKSTKSQPAMNTTAMASEAQSRWPKSASEGFEFRVRNKAQLSSMWVMKRADRFDVVFATNGGSRVNLTIPPDQFYALINAASELRSTSSTTEKCRDSFVQVHVVSAKGGRAVASCLDAKGKDADKLRLLGSTLSNYVR